MTAFHFIKLKKQELQFCRNKVMAHMKIASYGTQNLPICCIAIP